MTDIVRAALTETRNAFDGMPDAQAELETLDGRMDEVREANIAHNVELVARAAAAGARVVCLGELFPAPYFALSQHPVWFALAEDALAGPSISAMKAAAREHGTIVIAPIYELDGNQRFNTAVVIDEKGEVLGRYRKTHVPEGANEQAGFHETCYYDRSDGKLGDWPANVSKNPFFPVFQTSFGRIGVATCYDRHFPGAIAALADNGAQIVFSPAVTFGAKSKQLWNMEFRVDAARHNLFIGGSNRRGAEKPWGVEFFGGSYFTGPNGPVAPVAELAELVVCDLDLTELERGDPSGWNLARDARPNIYHLGE